MWPMDSYIQGDDIVGVSSPTPPPAGRGRTLGGSRNGLAGRHQHWEGPQSLKLRIPLQPIPLRRCAGISLLISFQKT